MKASICLIFALAIVGSSFSTPVLDKQTLQKLLQLHGKNLKDIKKPLIENEDAFLSVPQIIRKYGYPVEEHNVTTEDGYILTLHRIPYGKDSAPGENKPVVFLQHGLLCDSSNWIMNDEYKSLAYELANLGYDVWMGNARGNTYSRNHQVYSPYDDEFWQFSWHEMGIYDVPANIDYILGLTGQPDLYYVGHSMGTTQFFVAMSEKPEYNAKIKLMSALAPVAYMEDLQTPLIHVAPFVDQIEWILEFLGVGEFLPASALFDFLGQTACQFHFFNPFAEVCSQVLFLIAGYSVDQLDESHLPIILGHTPSGASVRSLVHYAQLINSYEFAAYDYGDYYENIEHYGVSYPPSYDLSKITAPIAFYWASNDWLTSRISVNRLANQIGSIERNMQIQHSEYNHLDFLWARDNDYLLNRHVIEFIQRH